MRVAVWVRGARAEASPRSGAPDLTIATAVPRGESARFHVLGPESLTFPERRARDALHAEGSGVDSHAECAEFPTRSERRTRSLFSRRERRERRERRRLPRRGGVLTPPRAGAAKVGRFGPAFLAVSRF